MKVLVTGGAGFIGSNLSNFLDKEINEVTALDDLSLGVESNLSESVNFVLGSVLNTSIVEDLVSKNDVIFHQAARSSSPMFQDDPRYGINVNLMGFMNVMQAAKKYGKKVIYASSSSVYNGLPTPFNENMTIHPKTFYESGFISREIMAKSYYLEYGVKSIGLRYFSVYGKNEYHKGKYANNISQFLWDLKENRSPIIYGDGNQVRDFTNIEDVVAANIFAANSDIDFGVYNVGTGKAYSFNNIIYTLNRKLGKTIIPTYVNNPIKNYVYETLADISKIRKEMNWEPRISIEEGIQSLL